MKRISNLLGPLRHPAVSIVAAAAFAMLAGAPGGVSPAAAQSAVTKPAAGPALGFTGSKMVMAKTVWQKFVSYLNNEAASGFGFFMISLDGQRSEVKACQDYLCQISPLEQDAALEQCKTDINTPRCVVFAEGRNIKMAYEVAP